MSRFSKVRPGGAWRATVAFVGVVAFGCATGALAFDEPVRGVTREEGLLPQPKIPAPKPPRSLFRCWQNGQVIFEGRGYGPLPTSQVVADLKPADPSAGRVQVLDMYEGLCILELPK